MKVIVQLCFPGTADDALELYKKAFGCEVQSMVHYRDAVAYGWEEQDDEKSDKVYHSEIIFGKSEIRLTDLGNPEQVESSQKLIVNLGMDSEKDVRKAFAVLAEEGTVIRELVCPPYMVIIGEVKDKFGIDWCLMCDFKAGGEK